MPVAMLLHHNDRYKDIFPAFYYTYNINVYVGFMKESRRRRVAQRTTSLSEVVPDDLILSRAYRLTILYLLSLIPKALFIAKRL